MVGKQFRFSKAFSYSYDLVLHVCVGDRKTITCKHKMRFKVSIICISTKMTIQNTLNMYLIMTKTPATSLKTFALILALKMFSLVNKNVYYNFFSQP